MRQQSANINARKSHAHRLHIGVAVGCGRAVKCKAATAQPVCIDAASSNFNPNIAVWQIPDGSSFPPAIANARILTLDHSGNLHSIYRPGQPLTGAYWDGLALLPALVPPGPIAILGLGAGTIAHLIHAYYPERLLHGWELDPLVVMMAEQHMGLKQLTDTGTLVAHVGDALDANATVGDDGAAGIIVDLFANGQLIPQLTQVSSWTSIRQRLTPGGRVMANLGRAATPDSIMDSSARADIATAQAALAAMAVAFEGQVTDCSMVNDVTCNVMAISGQPIDSQQWQQVPADLVVYVTRPWGAQKS